MNPETVARLFRAFISNFCRRFGSAGSPNRASQGDNNFHDWVFGHILEEMLWLSEQEAAAYARQIRLPVSLVRVSSYSERVVGGAVVVRMNLVVMAPNTRHFTVHAKMSGNTCTVRVDADRQQGETCYGTVRTGGWMRNSGPPRATRRGHAAGTHHGHSARPHNGASPHP